MASLAKGELYKMECVCGKKWTGEFSKLVTQRLSHNKRCNGWPMISDNPQAR